MQITLHFKLFSISCKPTKVLLHLVSCHATVSGEKVSSTLKMSQIARKNNINFTSHRTKYYTQIRWIMRSFNLDRFGFKIIIHIAARVRERE